jgi:hypothetical protein
LAAEAKATGEFLAGTRTSGTGSCRVLAETG